MSTMWPDMLQEALQMTDRNGDRPGVYVLVSNRGGGKTYPTARMLLNHVIDNPGREFAIIVRRKKHIRKIANSIFAKVLTNEFLEYAIRTEFRSDDDYGIIWLQTPENEEMRIGYVLPLCKSDEIKTLSGSFIYVDYMFMDEFQASEYLPGEVDALVDIHFSVSRGGDEREPIRYVPIVMCSNSKSILNPYFRVWGFDRQIQPDTKRYRGDGIVMLRFINEEIAEAQRKDPVNRAFSASAMVSSNIDNTWINDDHTFVMGNQGKGWGRGDYMATVYQGKNKYGIRYYPSPDLYHINRRVDESCDLRFDLGSGRENIPVFNRSFISMTLRDYMRMGKMRFSDLSCKSDFIDYLL